MLSAVGAGSVGTATVMMTSGRGHTPEELTERCVAKLISISDTADPMVQAQAHAFKDKVRTLILHYMKQAVASEHTTLINRFNAAGHPELVALLRE